MQKAFFLVVAIGAGIGLMLPTGKQEAPASVATVASPAPREQASAPVTPRETVLERVNGHFFANVEINGQLVRMMVDTGASTLALTEKDAARIGIPFFPEEYTEIGSGASGPVRGKEVQFAAVSLEGKELKDVRGVVIEGGEISLLGQAYLSRFSVEMRGDKMRIY